MRIPHDQTAAITFGIDIAHVGLPCRFEFCRRMFVPASSSSSVALSASAEARDAHEVGAHDYRHKIEETPKSWVFTKRQRTASTTAR